MILFFISCFENINTGAGGHYYSLLQMHKALQRPSKIVVFGDFVPQVYESEDVEFIKATKRDLMSADTRRLWSLGKVECVHFYDIDVALIASKVAAAMKVPLVCTKPGGPPIKPWSLSFKNQIVFHPFDYQYFKNRGPLAPAKLCQIANRVSWPKVAQNERISPFADADEGCVKILRIARIGNAYRQSMLQSIQLADKLHREYGPVHLALVGKIEDPQVYDNIEQLVRERDYVSLHTAKEFTLNAAELIPFADVVVGTGRGLIEGLSFGKPLFFPVMSESLPCFLTEASYDQAFYHNFSERVPRSEVVDPQARFDDFMALLRTQSLALASELSLKLFERDHLISVGAERLQKFYSELDRCERAQDFYLKYAHSRVLNAMKKIKRARSA